MPGWMTHKLESRFLGQISTTSDMEDTTLMAESEEELKSLWMKMKEESEKAGIFHSTFLREGNGNLLQYSCLKTFHGQRSLLSYSPWGRKS